MLWGISVKCRFSRTMAVRLSVFHSYQLFYIFQWLISFAGPKITKFCDNCRIAPLASRCNYHSQALKFLFFMQLKSAVFSCYRHATARVLRATLPLLFPVLRPISIILLESYETIAL